MLRNRGFTLIELMIVLVIVGVISAVAYPAYIKSAQKGRRADAKTSLTRISQALERCFTQYGKYDSPSCTPYIDSSPSFVSQNSDKGYYTITATALSDTAYTLQAAAVSGGPQAGDTDCATMTITSTGVQTPTDCW